MVEGYSGIRVNCGNTECVFEFVTYKYNGTIKKEEVMPAAPPNNDAAPPPSSGLARSQSMPPAVNTVAEQLGHQVLQLLLTTHQLTRSHTVDGSFPSRSGSVASDVFPNNNAASLTQQQDNRRGSDGAPQVVRGRGRALTRETSHQQGHGPGVNRSMGERGRSRHRSSSSGFVSPTQFESVSEEGD